MHLYNKKTFNIPWPNQSSCYFSK